MGSGNQGLTLGAWHPGCSGPGGIIPVGHREPRRPEFPHPPHRSPTPHTHMSRQGTVWTPPGPLGQKATRRKGNFRKQPGHPVSIPFLVCRAVGRKVVPPGTRHPPEEAGLQAQSTDTRSHLHLGPEQEGPGARGSRGATSSAPTLGAWGSRGPGAGAAVGGRGGETPQQGCSRPSPGNAACTPVMSPAQHRDQGALAGARPRQQRWCLRGQRRSVGPPGLCGT